MSEYTGTDNLEVMADAINYNDFLSSLVLKHARKNESIVDFGSGIGTFAREIAKNGFRVHCIEPDAKQAAMIAAAGMPVSTSIEEIPDGSIDYLYTLNVLEHIENDVDALRQLHRKLKPGGKILIYVPAFQVLFSSMDRKVGHFRRYTKHDLTAKLRNTKFNIVSARYVDSIGFFASLYFRFAGNDSGSLNHKALIFYDRVVFPISRVCDVILSPFFGKNVVVFAQKQARISP